MVVGRFTSRPCVSQVPALSHHPSQCRLSGRQSINCFCVLVAGFSTVIKHTPISGQQDIDFFDILQMVIQQKLKVQPRFRNPSCKDIPVSLSQLSLPRSQAYLRSEVLPQSCSSCLACSCCGKGHSHGSMRNYTQQQDGQQQRGTGNEPTGAQRTIMPCI